MVDQLLLPKLKLLLRFMQLMRQELSWDRSGVLHSLGGGVVRSQSLVAEALVVDLVSSWLPLKVVLVLVWLNFDPPLSSLHRLPNEVRIVTLSNGKFVVFVRVDILERYRDLARGLLDNPVVTPKLGNPG
jgi:hypothetical protein